MSLLDSPVPIRVGGSTRSLWKALALTVTLVLVALAILLPVMQSSDETAQGYRIHTLEQQRVDLQAKIYGTQSDIAQLGSLSRIDNEARNRLGMVPADRSIGVSVSAPLPSTHALPNRYVEPAAPALSPVTTSFWQRLLRLLPFS